MDDGNGVNRKQKSPWQLNQWRGSDRRCDRKVLREQRVEHRKTVWICNKARDLDDAPEAAPGIFEHCLQIREGLARLRFERITGNVAGRRIDPRLTGRVDEVTDTYGLRVRPDSGDAGAINDF